MSERKARSSSGFLVAVLVSQSLFRRIVAVLVDLQLRDGCIDVGVTLA